MQWPGIWACACHLGGTDWQLQPNYSDRDQYHRPGLLPQQVGVWRGMFPDVQNDGWQRVGGSGTGCTRPTPRLEYRVEALPRAKFGDMKGCIRKQTHPDHCHIPPSLHPGALTGIEGAPVTLPEPGSLIVRGPQCQHRTIPEPPHSECCWYADGVWYGGPPSSLPSMLTIMPHEDVITGEKS